MARRVRFERHPSRIVLDPSASSFVVSWTKCGVDEKSRLAASRDPNRWLPAVSAVADVCERGCVSGDGVWAAAASIGRAYDAGDRYLLDTDAAKKAAEMVRDLASMHAGKSDVWQAIRHLLDEIAHVRFANAPLSEFDERILVPLFRAFDACMAVDGFADWPPASMRRRFLYCLRRNERTQVAYTLVGLFFDVGSCPLLSLADRRTIRMRANSIFNGSGRGRKELFAFCLSEMASAKKAGLSSIGARMTQQQLADSLDCHGQESTKTKGKQCNS